MSAIEQSVSVRNWRLSPKRDIRGDCRSEAAEGAIGGVHLRPHLLLRNDYQAYLMAGDPEARVETSLYLPVKNFLEGLGYTVKGEVGHCDLVGLREDDPTMVVIGELKLSFNLELILQGVDRMNVGDEIWLAARLSARGKGRESDPIYPISVGASVLDY